MLTEATAIYRQATENDPATIDPKSLHGQLIRMQMDSIAEVMDVHQETLNREGIGFKGFIPAVFGRLVNEAFGRRAAGIAEMKVTAPPQLIRNPKVQPDEWELDVIQTRLMSSSWPKDQSYTAMAAKSGVQAQRTLIPEYYGPSCLTCHGSPQGEIDITGFPKETSPASRKRAPAKATSAASSASRCTDEPGAALVDRVFLALRYDL